MRRIASVSWIPLLTITGLLSMGCGDGSPTGPAEEIEGLPRDLSLNEELLITAGNDFAFRFLDQVYRSAPDSNLFLAPLSASMALGMTLNGAAGTTFEEMRSTLGFGSMSMDQINQGYRDLIDLLLMLDPSVEMGIGNSIWYRQGFPVRDDFLSRTKTYFDAEVSALDFANPGAADIINAWVKGETKGKIEEIVEKPIDAAAVMFLINAIYFKGSWTHRFPKDKTQPATFTAHDGSTGTVPLMELDDTLLYAETDSYQVVDLPYGGKAFSMTLLLPRANVHIGDLVAVLDPGMWAGVVSSLRRKEGTLHLPRFRMEWERELKKDLRAMGMNVPFIGGQADFSGLSDEAIQRGLYISKVKQKTYVDVNEEGTEAAGVTSVEIREVSIPDRFFFRADRPFLFVIRERFSETILFAGILVEAPEA
jgi:serpin B